MREEYDFINARRNPYTSNDIRQITLNLDANILNYFKDITSKTGIPYRILISSYLKDCVEKKREIVIN